MCVNYQTVTAQQLVQYFQPAAPVVAEGKPEIWQDDEAPILIAHQQQRRAVMAAYSIIPKKQFAPGVKRFSTMNARAETIASLRSFAQPWRDGQRCLVPMTGFYEPNYESGRAERWSIRRPDEAPFAVAGLFRTWSDAHGQTTYSFTQMTINADTHPLMQRFHRPQDEKRSLVIVLPEHYDAWLQCTDPKQAQVFLRPFAPAFLCAHAAPQNRRRELNHELF